MPKRKDGFWIYAITLGFVIVVLMAIDGSFGYLLSLISIPIGLIALASYFSPGKKSNKHDGAAEKFNRVTPDINKKTSETPIFKYNKRELVGKIEGGNFPSEIKNISDLKFLELRTNQPFEISDFVNQNPDIRYLRLTGPFWFKNNIKQSLYHLTIKYNDNIYKIIRQFPNLHQLQLLELHFKSLKLEEILQFCKSIKSLTLRVNLVEFPYEIIFNLPHLEYLDLSHNKIEKISPKGGLSYRSPKSKILYLNLSYNKIKKVPTSLFQLNSGIRINLKENPVRTSHLKKIHKDYINQIQLSYDQERIVTRTFHPQTLFALKVLLSLILLLFPVIVFGSFVGSVLIGIVVWSAWSV